MVLAVPCYMRHTPPIFMTVLRLGELAVAYYQQGDLETARQTFDRSAQLSRASEQWDDLANTFRHQGNILLKSGQLGPARKAFEEAERLCRQEGSDETLANLLGDKAVLLVHLGELDDALNAARESEQLCRACGLIQGIPIILGNKAGILLNKGDFGDALQAWREQEREAEQLGNSEAVAWALANQAYCLRLSQAPPEKVLQLATQALLRAQQDCPEPTRLELVKHLEENVLTNVDT
jgi:tetratricopeptide (TPR) repeat protein